MDHPWYIIPSEILAQCSMPENWNNGQAKLWTEFFNDAITELGVIFTPKRNARFNKEIIDKRIDSE